MQASSTSVSPTVRINDHDDICWVAQFYRDGAAKEDRDKLNEAFHEDARMFEGFMGTPYYDIPVAELFRLSETRPADMAKYHGRIISLRRMGDIAFAAVSGDGFWGTVSFVDYFMLTRMDGKWKISSETFAHTGGEPPMQ